MAGISIALRKMNEPDWPGVGTSEKGQLSGEQGYTYTYTSGDAQLTASDDDYDDYPFRVTIESTGFSPASASAENRSQFTMRAVVQLVPRRVNSLSEPANWAELNS